MGPAPGRRRDDPGDRGRCLRLRTGNRRSTVRKWARQPRRSASHPPRIIIKGMDRAGHAETLGRRGSHPGGRYPRAPVARSPPPSTYGEARGLRRSTVTPPSAPRMPSSVSASPSGNGSRLSTSAPAGNEPPHAHRSPPAPCSVSRSAPAVAVRPVPEVLRHRHTAALGPMTDEEDAAPMYSQDAISGHRRGRPEPTSEMLAGLACLICGTDYRDAPDRKRWWSRTATTGNSWPAAGPARGWRAARPPAWRRHLSR